VARGPGFGPLYILRNGNKQDGRATPLKVSALLLAWCLAGATLLTFGLGFWVTEQWRRASEQEAETRGEEAVALLAEALQRDMRGGQTSVLLPIGQPTLDTATLYDLADEFARGFARFPYLESFFLWRRTETGATSYFFDRTDRTPPWDSGGQPDESYPVDIRENPAAFEPLLDLATNDANRQVRFTLHEISIGGVPYQVCSQLFYERTPGSTRLAAVVGFTVNIDWTQQHYFTDFLEQMQTLIGDRTIGLRIVDAGGRVAATAGPSIAGTPGHARRFPLVFLDPVLVPRAAVAEMPTWAIEVDASHQAALLAAGLGAWWILALLAITTILTVLALVLTVRATAAEARFAAAQSELVSTVSHEMKTPLALIRLASNTLATGRYDSPDTISDYGRLLATESGRLTRLIDNILSFARFGSAQSAYHFERTDVSELIQNSVNRLRTELEPERFVVHVEVPADSVDVRADPVFLQQAIDNLVDNAVRHAASGHALTITAEALRDRVVITFADAGPGIPSGDLSRIFDKFYRGSNANVRQIVTDHGGTITVDSPPGQGATFRIVLPRWLDAG
jgi:signal transduction histidine kinase